MIHHPDDAVAIRERDDVACGPDTKGSRRFEWRVAIEHNGLVIEERRQERMQNTQAERERAGEIEQRRQPHSLPSSKTYPTFPLAALPTAGELPSHPAPPAWQCTGTMV